MTETALSPAATDVLGALRRLRRATVLGIMGDTGRSNSNVYNALHELQALGLVAARSLGPSDRTGGRPRNVYSLTEQETTQ